MVEFLRSCYKTSLPGFGLSVDSKLFSASREVLETAPDYKSDLLIFDNALDGRAVSPLLTAREYVMIEFMSNVTDKPDWDKKVFDEIIVGRWRTEAMKSGRDMTKKMLDWCILELREKATIFQETGIVAALDWAIYKSDSIVPSELRDALKHALVPLEDVPEALKDFHPHSDGLVVDLVHPSLFPLMYGYTKILKEGSIGLDDCITRSGDGAITVRPLKDGRCKYSQNMYSDCFQWLPCDVQLAADGGVKIVSYINNLHPNVHSAIYESVEKIIAKAIPLWTMTLEDAFDVSRCKGRIGAPQEDPWVVPKNIKSPENLEPDWERYHRILNVPEPGEYKSAESRASNKHQYRRNVPEKVDISKQFKDVGLQIIVKLANIELSPSKPSYSGGSWHVEAMSNEAICATAIYYYDEANVTESKLAFRAAVDEEMLIDVYYEQDDHEGIEQIYDFKNETPAIQDLGAVVTKAGRLLTFPNTYQHRVNAFQLADPTRPGYRKILALFLVDPNLRVISTANVPCQQAYLWQENIKSTGPLAKLPPEILQKVIENVDECPFTLEFAKQKRLKLMEERGQYQVDQTKQMEESTFFLCEH